MKGTVRRTYAGGSRNRTNYPAGVSKLSGAGIEVRLSVGSGKEDQSEQYGQRAP